MFNNKYKKLLSFFQPYYLLIITIFILSFLSVISTLYIPILFGQAIDHALFKNNVNISFIITVLSKILVLGILISIINWLIEIINSKISYQIIHNIRKKINNKINHLPISYFDKHDPSDIENQMLFDSEQIGNSLLFTFAQLFTGFITIIFTFIFIMFQSIYIGIIILILSPLNFLLAKFIAQHSYNSFQKQAELQTKQTCLIEEMIGEKKTIQTLNYQNIAKKRFFEINNQLCQTSQKAIFYSSLINPITRFINAMIYTIVAFITCLAIFYHHLSVGSLAVLLSYTNQYMKPFTDISAIFAELQNAFACSQRVFKLLNEKEEIDNGNQIIKTIKGNITFNNVSFYYQPKIPLFEQLNLSIKAGQHIAIVGKTGSGKTTLLNLLMRFYETINGSIKIDGVDIKQISKKELRKYFGVVLQETWLYNASIYDNLCLGNPNARERDIAQAIQLTNSQHFIDQLPNGLKTLYSDTELSQGEKQLLCIMRLIIAKPTILILDEATSAIDTSTELQIQKALDHLMQKRTTFIIAHRLSTIKNADLILVMHNGQIIEKGTHQFLMQKKGFYYHLYKSQFTTT